MDSGPAPKGARPGMTSVFFVSLLFPPRAAATGQGSQVTHDDDQKAAQDLDEGPGVSQGIRRAGGGVHRDGRDRQGAPPRRSQPGRTCAPDEDDAEHRGAARKRPRPALDAHAAAVRQSDGAPAQDQLSADKGEDACGMNSRTGFSCSPDERSDIRGHTRKLALDVAAHIRATDSPKIC
jgi:hypothetical protein